MNDRPNIFDYATKELSQDAMICWFLACIKCKNSFYKHIGVEFAKFLLKDESIKVDEICVKGPYSQCYRMDVYAVLCIKNTAIPLIFEDKTDTYLHSNQMKNYCKKVHNWKNEKYMCDIKEEMGLEDLSCWGKTRYIYFKTGYVPKWQEIDYEKQIKCFEKEEPEIYKDTEFRTIYIDDIIEFLDKLSHNSEEIIEDYRKHLKQKMEENKKSNFAKWDLIFNKIFGKYIQFESSYQGWAAKSFMYFDEGKDERHIWYSLRCGWWKKTGFAIAFQQYRNENRIKRNKAELEEKRNVNTEEIKEICKDIFTKLNQYGLDFDNYVEDNDGKDQNNFFKISIYKEKSSVENENIETFVCDFFKDFLKLFIDAAKEKYGDRVKITENVE